MDKRFLTPEEVAKCESSYTGEYLKKMTFGRICDIITNNHIAS